MLAAVAGVTCVTGCVWASITLLAHSPLCHFAFISMPSTITVATSLNRKGLLYTSVAEAESQQRVAGVGFHFSCDESKKELTELTDEIMVNDLVSRRKAKAPI